MSTGVVASPPSPDVLQAAESPLSWSTDSESSFSSADSLANEEEEDAASLGADSNSSSPMTTPDISDPYGSPSPFNFEGEGGERPSFILVVGGLGYIGSHTVIELLREGFNVIIVDNLSNSYESVLHSIKKLAAQHSKEKGVPQPLLHFHRVDYRSRSMRFLLESYSDLVPASAATSETGSSSSSRSSSSRTTYRSRISGVIHFAAYKSVAESIDMPLQYYKNNVSGLVSLLQLLDRHNIRNFIFSSSATVYGTKANEGVPLREDDLIHHPRAYVDAAGNEVVAQPTVSGLTCPYARTKYFSEAILADLAVSDPRWHIVALRYFNPVGSDPSGALGDSPRNAPTNLFAVLTHVLKGARPALDVYGSDYPTRDGTAIRDYVHVFDVARGHIAALRRPDGPSPAAGEGSGGFRAYNLGSGSGTTVLEAVRSLESAAKQAIPLKVAGRRPGDVGVCVASTERAAAELGWFPRESIAQCAADLWNFVQRSAGVVAGR